MSFWGFIFSAIFSIVVSLLGPKPRIESARPKGLGDFTFPTTSQGRNVPIIFGTVMHKGPNVVWYGDKSETAITEKVKTGLFSSKTVIKGFRYSLGIQYGLCLGDEISLERIKVAGKEAWTGSLTNDGDVATISDSEFFNGDDFGKGGLDVTVTFYTGSETQPVDPYLAIHQQVSGVTPAYNFYSHAVVRGYIGNSEQMDQWEYELKRIPDPLGLGVQALINSKDANPANILYELYTNTEYGKALPLGDLDSSSFTTSGGTLYTEGNGFSMILDNSVDIDEMIEEIKRQIDGDVVFDRSLGKWKLNLFRSGYDIDSVPQITDDNVKVIEKFDRGSWDETINELRVKFFNRENEYTEAIAFAQNMGNQRIQGTVVSGSPITYSGVKNNSLANSLVWRDLFSLSQPLASCSLTVNREFWNINRGDIVAFNNNSLQVTKLPMRVTKAELGNINNDEIQLDLIEDAFAYKEGLFSAPAATAWSPPTNAPINIPDADRMIFEAPKAFVDADPKSPGVHRRIWAGFMSQGKSEVFYNLYVGTESVGVVVGSLYVGTLRSAVGQVDHDNDIEVDTDPSSFSEILSALDFANDGEIGISLKQIVMINNEFIGFRTYTNNSSWIRLDECYRGLMDSAIAKHEVDDRVWFLYVAGGLTDESFSDASVSIKPLPRNSTGELPIADATATVVTMADRYHKPYPPSKVEVNGTLFPSSVALSDDISAGDDGSGLDLEYVRRDYRTDHEVLAVMNENTLPSDFPANNNTRYSVECRNDPNAANSLLITSDYASTGQRLFDRTEILRETAGVVPSRMRFVINTRHTVATVDYDGAELVFDFDTTDSDLASSTNLGLMNDSDIVEVWSSAPDSGSYSFTLGSDALGSGHALEARLNGGSWVSLIASGSTSGILAGVTAGDQVEIRHDDDDTDGNQTLMIVDPPTTSDRKHAILII